MRAARGPRVGRHVLGWAGVSVFFLVLQLGFNLVGGTRFYDWSKYLLALLPTFVLGTYPLLYGVLPRVLGRGSGAARAGLLLAWAVGSALLADALDALYRYRLAPALLGEQPPQPFSWEAYATSPTFAFFALLVVAGGAAAVRVHEDQLALARQGQELRQRQLTAELQLLKAQLQPAFLFEALHTLRVLTRRGAPEAPGAVLHLADLLRYLLYDGPRELVPLADEAAMMQHYVALEQLRLGARVEVSLSVSGALEAHRIAPLLLLPLVENAFRHGTGPAAECPWVSLDLVARPELITFKVLNSQPPGQVQHPAASEGPGLRRLRERLVRLYPGRHELKLVAEPDTFLVLLRLHLTAAPAVPASTSSPIRYETPMPAGR